MAEGLRERFSLDGKVAVVTGGSRGIGEAIARGLAEFGARVVVSSRKQDAVDRAVEGLRADGFEAVGIAANVSRMEEARGLVDRAVETYGQLDIVVNNAAANPVFGPVQNVEEPAFDKIMDTNVKGPFELCKRAHAVMQGKGGSIVNISSVEGLTPGQGLGIYSVSKAALISLTRVLAKEWGPDGIRVNALCPGLIRTDFSRALWSNEGILNHVLGAQPISRIGTPEEAAALAVFLASDAAAYCTGGVYTVDGGYTI